MRKRCSNCSFVIHLKEEAYKVFNNKCPKCGAELAPKKLPPLNKLSLQKKVSNTINKWFGEMGIERTLEMMENNTDLPNAEYFQIELFNRGLILKTGGIPND